MNDSPDKERNISFGGSCACSRIRYESKNPPKLPQSCHCITCRKLGGGPNQSFIDAIAKDVTFYDTKQSLQYQGLPKDSTDGIAILHLAEFSERMFCTDCYSPLAMRYKHEHDDDLIWLTFGTVDEETIRDENIKNILKPKFHIFGSQAAWWDAGIKDGLHVFERFSGTIDKDIEKWKIENLH